MWASRTRKLGLVPRLNTRYRAYRRTRWHSQGRWPGRAHIRRKERSGRTAVSSCLLRPVEGLVGRLHDLIGRRVPVVPFRHSDAHRDRDPRTGLPALVVLRLDPRPEPPPHGKSAGLDDFAQLLEMRQALVLALAR